MRKQVVKAVKEEFPIGMHIWYVGEQKRNLFYGVILEIRGDQILVRVVDQRKGTSKEPVERLVPRSRLKELKT